MDWIAGSLLLAAVDRIQKSNVMQLTNQGKQPLERQRLLRLLFSPVSLGILRTARRTSRRYARPYLAGITPGQVSLRCMLVCLCL